MRLLRKTQNVALVAMLSATFLVGPAFASTPPGGPPLPPIPGLQPVPDMTVPPGPQMLPSAGVPFGRVNEDGDIVLTPAEVARMIAVQKKAAASLRDAASGLRIQGEKDRIGLERAERWHRLLDKIK